MSNENKQVVRKSLANSWKALLYLLQTLHVRYPLLFIFFFWLIYKGLQFIYIHATSSITVILCFIVGVLSIGVYAKTKSFFESNLAFLLGVLTIFSISWTLGNAIIVGGAFFFFFALFILISSISLSAEIETILTHAASFMKYGVHEENYKILRDLASEGSKYGQMDIVERAKAIRYMVFMKLEIDSIRVSLHAVETIKVAFQVDLEQALNFFKGIYMILKRAENQSAVVVGWEFMLERITELPISPQEFLSIFNATQRVVLRKYGSLYKYIGEVEQLLENGYDNQSIIESLIS